MTFDSHTRLLDRLVARLAAIALVAAILAAAVFVTFWLPLHLAGDSNAVAKSCSATKDQIAGFCNWYRHSGKGNPWGTIVAQLWTATLTSLRLVCPAMLAAMLISALVAYWMVFHFESRGPLTLTVVLLLYAQSRVALALLDVTGLVQQVGPIELGILNGGLLLLLLLTDRASLLFFLFVLISLPPSFLIAKGIFLVTDWTRGGACAVLFLGNMLLAFLVDKYRRGFRAALEEGACRVDKVRGANLRWNLFKGFWLVSLDQVPSVFLFCLGNTILVETIFNINPPGLGALLLTKLQLGLESESSKFVVLTVLLFTVGTQLLYLLSESIWLRRLPGLLLVLGPRETAASFRDELVHAISGQRDWLRKLPAEVARRVGSFGPGLGDLTFQLRSIGRRFWLETTLSVATVLALVALITLTLAGPAFGAPPWSNTTALALLVCIVGYCPWWRFGDLGDFLARLAGYDRRLTPKESMHRFAPSLLRRFALFTRKRFSQSRLLGIATALLVAMVLFLCATRPYLRNGILPAAMAIAVALSGGVALAALTEFTESRLARGGAWLLLGPLEACPKLVWALVAYSYYRDLFLVCKGFGQVDSVPESYYPWVIALILGTCLIPLAYQDIAAPVRALRAREFLKAERALGTPLGSRLWKVFGQSAAPAILSTAFFCLANVVLLDAAMSFVNRQSSDSQMLGMRLCEDYRTVLSGSQHAPFEVWKVLEPESWQRLESRMSGTSTSHGHDQSPEESVTASDMTTWLFRVYELEPEVTRRLFRTSELGGLSQAELRERGAELLGQGLSNSDIRLYNEWREALHRLLITLLEMGALLISCYLAGEHLRAFSEDIHGIS